MEFKTLASIVFTAFLILTCNTDHGKEEGVQHEKIEYRLQLESLKEASIKAAITKDFGKIEKQYTDDAILMAEYQPTIEGRETIALYYNEIFKRQQIKSYTKEITEIINLDSTFIEIGIFKKVFLEADTDTEQVQNGKYWNTWALAKNDSLKLKGEAFGFFHPIENPNSLLVDLPENGRQAANNVPLELRAYRALGEKGVQERDGILRAEMYSHDGKFMPFADTTKTGMSELQPYLIAYNSGNVKIDSIHTYTHRYENHQDYILEYSKFYVSWQVPNFSGVTTGKGVRIWKREEDNTLRIFRQLGSHNHKF
ncbi:hypothetical protein N9954_06185 [Maribacter sp.]|nr:hypothetical protein [Maribacter sp.]